MKLRWTSALAGLVATVAAAATLVAAPAASATTTPPFEPDPQSLGSITLYDASGNAVHGGSTLASPIAAYAVASGTTSDTGATSFAHLGLAAPNGQPDTSLYANEQTSSDTTYPVSGAAVPAVVSGAGASTPVVTGAGSDLSIAGFLGDFTNSATSSSPYYQLYQLRLYTPSTSSTTPAASYFSIDIAVDSATNTWTQVYPTPPSSVSTSVSTPTATPASPADHGASVTLSTTVSPANTAGTVTWYDGASALSGGTYTQSSGAASLTLTPADGDHSYTAVFTPTDANAYTGSTSGALAFHVNAQVDDTVTTLTPTNGSFADVTAPLTLTATVADTTVPGPVTGGSVTFRDGSTTVATVAVSAGSASTQVAANTLSLGAHSFTATYEPSAAYHGSSSPASAVTVYTTTVTTVQTLPAPSNFVAPTVGAARVGVADTCNPGAWYYAGSYTYAWYLDSSTTPFAYGRTTGRIPAAWRGHRLSCRVTVSNTGNTPVTAVSGQVTVLPGAAVHATIRPRIVGTVKVGRTVKAYVGAWSATPVRATSSKYLYLWKAGSTIVSRAAAYKIPLAYRGRYLVLYVYAVRGGFATGVSSSVPVRIG